MNKSATAEQESIIDKPLAQLDDYRLLGASGLRVSPLCLGAMTFGANWGQWGAGFEESKRMFDFYVEKGGNFIDTANVYTNGTSEQYVGELVAPIRSQMVVATKYSINLPPFPGLPPSPTAKNANYGGNHRKALVQGLDESLKRMKLDYVDVLYVHACDGVWDVISDEAACRIVASESDDILKASMKLRDYAYLFGSQDNISVIIVKFK
ncbi:Aryl-alcohol dehydrogenase (NADP+), putative [Acanthamoeba castellanii str. Neff]|uniref:Aryl-alcohol dehydrogenase (NADP+), putative n=1 Tax=Acanthamoeba castellanii (strain ATCC 30010 / Neff) TaxID=1257118 RepID=L8GQ90_ACACF|nr:Aryl-alcohol dehydrogenase (NADP+), putative [Acanthamoeba castellanii str. Neff]ELR15354.1 Aryl-alcohol dehydrogenase (NADP+), putative [Acanthamoeba castellanii str. Neff]